MKLPSCGMALAMTAALAIGNAGAAPTGAFQVNSVASATTPGQPFYVVPFQQSAVARSADGSFVMAWSGAEGSDTNYELYVRVFQKDGTPLSDEFVANATASSPASEPMMPAVAISDSGHFVVSWDQTDQTNMYRVVRKARLFSTGGATLSGEFCLEPGCAVAQASAPKTLVMDAQGNFVAAWIGIGSSATNPNGAVLMRRFAADGTPNDAAPVIVTNHPDESLGGLAAAVDPASGDYFIAWQEEAGLALGQSLQAFTLQNIAGQRFHSSGKAAGLRILVSSCTNFQSVGATLVGCENYSVATTIAVTMDAAGNATVLWWEYGRLAGTRYYGQRYDALGLPKGAAFVVAALSGENQIPFWFSAAGDGAGDLMLVWTSYPATGDLITTLYGQKVKANNQQDGGIFQLSTNGISTRTAAVAADPAGDVVAAWIEVQSPYNLNPQVPETDVVLGELFTLP